MAGIRNAGGTVTYNWEWENGKSTTGGKPWAPMRPVNLLGVDYFGHVTQVSYAGRTMHLLRRQLAIRN